MRRMLAVILTAIVVGSGAAVPARAASALDWRPCQDDPALDCASLSVPVDWARPGGPRFDLALARRKATDPSARIGSLLINPGGPGGSGIDFARRADGYFSEELRSRFDIVGWDPRGVGRSHPVVCDEDLVNNPVSEFPKTAEEFAALKAYHTALGRNCRALTGPLFDHVDTVSTVRDLDAIRAALGETRLTYYGISYGTGIGQQYAELFPGRIRALALDSNMDHSIGASRYMATETVAFEQSYTQFADWCLRTPSCELAPRDPRTVLDTLYDRATRGELTDPGEPDREIAPEELLDTVLGALFRITNWHSLAQDLLSLLTESGQVTMAAAERPAPRHGAPVENTYQAIWCEDHAWNVDDFADLERLRHAMNRLAPHTRVSTLGWTDVTGCLGWPRPLNNPQHRLDVRGAPPILMTNGLFDVSTPYPWATNAASQMRQAATLLTYEGTGHGDYVPSPCARAAIDAYLIRLATPQRGTHCPAVFP
jgi:pimeloyl-ACP methyl ester carboxylesterase